MDYNTEKINDTIEFEVELIKSITYEIDVHDLVKTENV